VGADQQHDCVSLRIGREPLRRSSCFAIEDSRQPNAIEDLRMPVPSYRGSYVRAMTRKWRVMGNDNSRKFELVWR
jgi:hypothetical protein